MPEISFNKKSTLPVKEQPQVYKNLLFEAVLLLVVGLLFYHFLLTPKMNDLSAKKAQLDALNTQSDNVQQNVTELNSLIAQMKGAKKDISVLDEALPLDSRVTTIHVLLDSLVSSSGLTLANISTDTNDALISAGDTKTLSDPFGVQRQLQVVPINLSVTGTMDQFLGFLKALEKNARILDVSSVQITGNKNNLASFAVTVKTYFYGPAIASLTTPAPAQ